MVYCYYTKKHAHGSRAKAEAQLRSIKKRWPDYDGVVYPCLRCPAWHVGRKNKNRKKNKYR